MFIKYILTQKFWYCWFCVYIGPAWFRKSWGILWEGHTSKSRRWRCPLSLCQSDMGCSQRCTSCQILLWSSCSGYTRWLHCSWIICPFPMECRKWWRGSRCFSAAENDTANILWNYDYCSYLITSGVLIAILFQWTEPSYWSCHSWFCHYQCCSSDFGSTQSSLCT